MIEILTGATARHLGAEVTEVYREAFAAPPYLEGAEEVGYFRAAFSLEVGEPGFRCGVARDGAGRLVGFSYGYQALLSGPTGAWDRRLLAAVGPERSGWVCGQFLLAWLAVRPSHQGRGVGGALHDALMAGVTQPHAWLVTSDQPTSARCLYERRGWQKLGAAALGWHHERRLIFGVEPASLHQPPRTTA